jgi:hypothetical protein
MESVQPDPEFEPQLRQLLDPDETLRVQARVRDALIAVSDRRLVVATRERVALNVSFDELRRIQFDIERDRPATMVIVPEEAHNEPQVLAIPPEAFKKTAEALALIGHQLARLRQGQRPARDSEPPGKAAD